MNRKGKLVYWATFAASYPVWVAAAWPCSHYAARAFSQDANWGMIAFSAALAAATTARSVCRRLDLSGQHTRRETLPREGPAREIPGGEGFWLHRSREMWAVPGVLAGFAAVAFLCLVLFAPCVPGTERVGYELSATLALASTICWYARSRGPAIAAALDEDGIRASGRQVAWDEIASAEVRAEHNVFGHPSRTLCRFRDSTGGTLLTVDLSAVPEEERRRFVEAVRAKQGLPPGERTELEAAMPPAGRGTELEAASAPAGRGTELEAAAHPEAPRRPGRPR